MPEDTGLAGSPFLVRDINTTGAFTVKCRSLGEMWPDANENPFPEAQTLVQEGSQFSIVSLPGSEPLSVADALKGWLFILFNVSVTDDRLCGAGRYAKPGPEMFGLHLSRHPLCAENDNNNEVTAPDIEGLNVTQCIKTGRTPWGVAVGLQ